MLSDRAGPAHRPPAGWGEALGVANPVVLGVAGGTGSGKTSVARAILRAVGRDRLAFLAEDSYYRDVVWGAEHQLHSYNFDHPSAIDTPLLIEHLRELRGGRMAEVPVYDFVHHRRTAEHVRVEPGRRASRDGEPPNRAIDRFAHGQPAAFRASAWAYVASGSITASRLPSRTRSRECTVRLMR